MVVVVVESRVGAGAMVYDAQCCAICRGVDDLSAHVEMAGSISRSLAAPSADDLHGLLKLCGSEEATVAYLARIYNLPAEEIAPTFKAWLRELPPVAPPSRQRSAPPMVNSLMSAGAPGLLSKRGVVGSALPMSQVMPIVPPPPEVWRFS